MTKKITIIWEQFISCCYRLANTHFHTTYRYVCISLFWYWEKTHLYSFNTSNPWLEFLVGQIMLKKEILEFLPVPWDYSGRQTLLQPRLTKGKLNLLIKSWWLLLFSRREPLYCRQNDGAAFVSCLWLTSGHQKSSQEGFIWQGHMPKLTFPEGCPNSAPIR